MWLQKGKSCLIFLLVCYDGVTASADMRRATDVIYLDFCSAFVTVPHNITAVELKRRGFDRWTIWSIRNWLDDHVQRLTVKGSVSKWRSVTNDDYSGVHTATVPYNIFINDIGRRTECTLNKFADKSKLSGEADMLEERDAIQRNINKLEEWGPCGSHEVQQGQVQGPAPGSGQSQVSIQTEG